MALLDFLGQDVGGYAQGPMPNGSAGVPQTGITWDHVLRALSSRSPGTQQMLGLLGGVQQQKQGNTDIYRLSNAMFPDQQQQSSSGSNDLGEAASLFSILKLAGVFL